METLVQQKNVEQLQDIISDIEKEDNVRKTYLSNKEMRHQNACLAIAYQNEEDKEKKDEAATALIQFNGPMLVKLAGQYARYYPDSSNDYEDIYWMAAETLLKAASKWDETKSAFVTYAYNGIANVLHSKLRDSSRLIRVPHSQQEALYKEQKKRGSMNEVLKDSKLSKTKKKNLVSADRVKNIVSFDAPVEGDDDVMNLFDIVADAAVNVEEQVLNKQMARLLMEKIDILTPKELTVIEHRYGLNHKPFLIYKDIGEILGITDEACRKIEKKALTKLRAALS